MIQETYQRAMKYAGAQHAQQLVPGTTANYLLHLSNVAMEVLMAHHHSNNFDLEYAIQLAILHDTIEDTSSTYADIKNLFGTKVADGVNALTKDESLPTKQAMMRDSLKKINAQSIEVGIVKLADRITNLQSPPPHWSAEKIKKYLEEAKLISKTLSNKNEYLNNRIELKISEYAKNMLN